jgi:hypothetical protein
MKSIVFCRHFEDYKQTRTERRTISIKKRTNIEKRSLSASILLSQTIYGKTKLMLLDRTNALNIIKQRSQIPFSFFTYHQPT